MLKTLALVLIFLGFAASNVLAFNLPKLKITYTQPVSRIHGSTAGLPVLTVNFVKTPLWKALQKISAKTGYMFTSRRVNLGADITLAGKYNLAPLLNKLFAKDTVRIIPQTKKIQIEGK
ncbi:MAG: hypothetical protein M0Z57_07080 [Deltaproteobacteria bacterium]|nr:hypothetical protein [Deltaproteobacteria bacterium]